MRTITIHATASELEQSANYLYAAGCDSDAMEQAIGYLTLWGLGYPVVDIYLMDKPKGEFTACYRNKPLDPAEPVAPPPAYTIGAVFNECTRRYGFHS